MTDHDPINRPAHYTAYPVEVIELTECLNFNMGNVIKYVSRADHKGRPIEDLRKARWYLDRELARRERVAAEALTPAERLSRMPASGKPSAASASRHETLSPETEALS